MTFNYTSKYTVTSGFFFSFHDHILQVTDTFGLNEHRPVALWLKPIVFLSFQFLIDFNCLFVCFVLKADKFLPFQSVVAPSLKIFSNMSESVITHTYMG